MQCAEPKAVAPSSFFAVLLDLFKHKPVFSLIFVGLGFLLFLMLKVPSRSQFGVSMLGFCLLCLLFLKFVLWVPSYSNCFLRQTCGYFGILSQEEAASQLAFILGILGWEQLHLGLYPARLQEAPLNRPQESKALTMMKYVFLDLL